MSFDYDTLDAAPVSAIELTQSTVYVTGSVWRTLELRVPVDSKVLYTRTDTPVAVDLKTYDMGRVWIASEGCDGATPQGYIEVEYTIELMDKQPNSLSVLKIESAVDNTISQWYAAPAATYTGTRIFNPLADPGGTILYSSGPTIDVNGKITLDPERVYLVFMSLTATNATPNIWTVDVLVNGVVDPKFNQQLSTNSNNEVAASAVVVQGTSVEYQIQSGTSYNIDNQFLTIILLN